MKKSARVLGEEYGLTAQEMNYILKKQGFLQGEAGEYSVTAKGAPFAEEQDFHRGTGGYANYNRYWTTRSWDENIIDELGLTEDSIREAREAVAASRKQHWEEIKAARAEADAAFLARYNQNQAESAENIEAEDESDDGLLVAGIAGLLLLGYGIYKAVPHVVKWWKGNIAPKLKGQKKMICPACAAIMEIDRRRNVWKCQKCTYSVSEKAITDGEVFWFCDKCESFLNTQPGFTTSEHHWICSKCGFDNDVSDANISSE